MFSYNLDNGHAGGGLPEPPKRVQGFDTVNVSVCLCSVQDNAMTLSVIACICLCIMLHRVYCIMLLVSC